MFMKPPAPASRGPNFDTLRLPSAVGLRESEKCKVQTATVVEVELVRLINDRLRVGRRAEAEPAGGNSADDAWLRGERKKINDPFLSGNATNALGHADAEIDDTVRLQLERGAARNHVPVGHRHDRDRGRGHPDLAGETPR